MPFMSRVPAQFFIDVSAELSTNRRIQRQSPNNASVTNAELSRIRVLYRQGLSAKETAKEVAFERLCDVRKIVGAWRVVWGGQLTRGVYDLKRDAVAQLQAYQTKAEKPQLPDYSEGLHTGCWGVWEFDADTVSSFCNRCHQERPF